MFLDLLDRSLDVRVRFRLPGGDTVVGKNGEAESFVVEVHRARMFERVLSYGNLGLGESFMDGDFDVVAGGLPGFVTALERNRLAHVLRRDKKLLLAAASIRLKGMLRPVAKNVRLHYDLGLELFESFLDPTLTYSCGYQASPDDDLAQLQKNKLDRICRKLRLGTGQSVFDIGCGFGGLLLHAAREYGVTGLGVTLSRTQFEVASERVREAGLE
ncbi:MAG: class I SAM-dependent methyltransferase, partial [Planctomycetota bacterium]